MKQQQVVQSVYSSKAPMGNHTPSPKPEHHSPISLQQQPYQSTRLFQPPVHNWGTSRQTNMLKGAAGKSKYADYTCENNRQANAPLEGRGGSVKYPPDWEDALRLKNKASHSIQVTQSFVQGHLPAGGIGLIDDPGAMWPSLHPHSSQLSSTPAGLQATAFIEQQVWWWGPGLVI